MADDPNNNTPNTPDLDNPAIKDAIAQAVANEVQGLKAKNTELLGKLKDANEHLKPWEGLDPEQVRTLMARLGQDEEARLIAEGRVDEVVNRRVQQFVDRTNKQLDTATKTAEEMQAQATQYRNLYAQAMLDNAVANRVTGLNDGALDIVQQQARGWFTVTDGGAIEPTDNAPLDRSGKPLQIEALAQYLLEIKPFLFKASQGAGTGVGKASLNGSLRKSQMSTSQKAKFIREHGGEAYEQLPWN